MNAEACAFAECHRQAAVCVYRVSRRRIMRRTLYCDDHASLFLLCDLAGQQVGGGPLPCRQDAIAFDLERLVYDCRPDIPCLLTLREIGGTRRLEFKIGAIEAVALVHELERLVHPRPLTHRAMVSAISALGGRVEHVIIDRPLARQVVAYEAKLHLKQMDKTVIVDMRPSDAIPIALICDVPILVSTAVLAAS